VELGSPADMKTIISNSGGLDSTYALWKIASSTNDEIVSLHLDASKITDRLRQKYDIRSLTSVNGQKDRATQITDWISRSIRQCSFVCVELGEQHLRQGIENINSQQTLIVDWAVSEINAGRADRLIIATERENDGYSNGGTLKSRSPGSIAARDRFIAEAKRGRLDFILLDAGYHQGVAIRELPPELMSMTRSCDGMGEEPCGVCFKCSKRKFFCEAILHGKTDDDLREYISSKSELPSGRWRSMKDWLRDDISTYNCVEIESWAFPVWPSSVDKGL